MPSGGVTAEIISLAGNAIKFLYRLNGAERAQLPAKASESIDLELNTLILLDI